MPIKLMQRLGNASDFVKRKPYFCWFQRERTLSAATGGGYAQG